MGRRVDKVKETAFEALLRIMTLHGMRERPRPSQHRQFVIVKGCVDLWQGVGTWARLDSDAARAGERHKLLRSLTHWPRCFRRRSTGTSTLSRWTRGQRRSAKCMTTLLAMTPEE